MSIHQPLIPDSVTIIDPLDSGHHTPYAIWMARELVARGLQVNLIGSARFIEAVSAEAEISRSQVLSIYDGPIEQYHRSRVWKKEGYNFRFLRRALKIAADFGSETIHLVYLDYFLPSAFLNVLLSRPRARLFGTLHWTYFLPGSAASRWKNGRNLLHIWSLRRLLRGGMQLQVHSHSFKPLLRELSGSDNVTHIPYPIEEPPADVQARARELRAGLQLQPDQRLILLFGGTRQDKGADLALRLLARLPERYRLMIAGPAQHFKADDIERMAREAGVQDRLYTNLNFIPHGEAESYFAASDVVLLPYRPVFSGQSGVLSVAATLGVPVAASDSGTMRETVEAYQLGEVFPCEDLDAMQAAVERVVSQPYQGLTEQFRRDHSLEQFADQIVRHYRAEPELRPPVQGVAHAAKHRHLP
ncbi:glycosyltransferase [Deinococcus sonorensis]|uniref:Glycosyltransferase n=2 Tax=Deinococcus sonorensis TaxID=309891 RepID=A0AAU7UCL6_9DEIO